jgi:nitrate reductase NapE component
MGGTDDTNRTAWSFFCIMIVGLFAILAVVHVLHL